MAQNFVDPGQIRSYHAHIYYDPETRPVAERLREAIGSEFTVELGRWHDEPVGPHPISMYQVAFPVAEFPRLVPCYDDHAIHALWLGAPLPLRLEGMRRRRQV